MLLSLRKILKNATGFTLAELLISLAILGVIATFTIPKILSAQQDSKNKALTKEAAATISAAYQAYRLSSSISASVGIKDLTPFMNYVSIEASANIDNVQGQGTDSCSSQTCLKLHNGAILSYMNAYTFGGTSSTNAVWFHIDPDGRVTDGTTNGPGKSVPVFLYTTGRITDEGNLLVGTTDSNDAYTANANNVPPWFSW